MEKTVRKPKFAAKQPDNFLAGLLLGGLAGSLAGAATMLFLAPQSGKETRQQIQQKAIELRDQTVATVDDAMAKVRTKAGQIKTDVSDKAKELKQQGQDVLSEGLGRVSEAAKNSQMAVQGTPIWPTPIGDIRLMLQQSRLNQAETADNAGDNPALSNVSERNIQTIIKLHLKAAGERSLQDWTADIITSFSGRMIFAHVHVVWFCVWILLNTGNLGIKPFDPYPYGLLTMIVSLEAIFLSTFVLISQNRLSQEAEHRADLDMHIGLLTEHELTRVLQMLDTIQDKLGIDNDKDSELAGLEMETRPEDVLAEIEGLQGKKK